MIVRIATEGQYELPDSETDKLNELDNQAVDACGAGDEQRFQESIGEDDLRGSDVILPPPDVSLEEAKEEFSGDGLIPG